MYLFPTEGAVTVVGADRTDPGGGVLLGLDHSIAILETLLTPVL